MRTFLSYARGDAQAQAQTLRDQLNDARRVTWLDRHEIPAGADWWDQAQRAIVNANAFVLLITPQAMASEPVRREYQLALALRKHFIPILVKPVADPLESSIKNRNYRDLTANYADGLAKLIGDLEQAWDDVTDDLTRLSFDDGKGAWTPLPPVFSSVVQTLENAAKARTVRPPEAFFAFADLLRKMRDDQSAARPLLDLVTEAFAGSYPDPTWHYSEVARAHAAFLQQLLAPVRDSLSPLAGGEVIPIVLVVMTDHEAKDLAAGNVFAGNPGPLQGQFNELQKALAVMNITDCVDRYHARPDAWQPFDASVGAPTIGTLIRQELSAIQDVTKPLVPQFIDIRGIDSVARRSELRGLRYGGCVVVMDLLSMCHPQLHDAFLNSRLDCQERVFLVQVSPLGTFPKFKELTLSFKKRFDLEFWDRYSRDKDAGCRQVGSQVDLERFISLEMINVLPPDRRPKTGVRNYIGR